MNLLKNTGKPTLSYPSHLLVGKRVMADNLSTSFTVLGGGIIGSMGTGTLIAIVIVGISLSLAC